MKVKNMKLKVTLALTVISAQHILAPLSFGGAVAPQQAQGTVEGYVLPSNVEENEPFTFAATGMASGEVVQVQTISGEVIATAKPDPMGRVFVAGGLAAGLYTITRALSGGGKPSRPVQTVPLQVRPNTGGAPSVSNALQLTDPQKFFSTQSGLSWKGSGMNPNAAEMEVSAGTLKVPVLAATSDEIKTGPLGNMKPAAYDFIVRNKATGQETQARGTYVYDCMSRLTRTRIGNGDMTSLEFELLPMELAATVDVKILSGPVHFPGGVKETQVKVENGKGSVPILGDAAGSGRFEVSWSLANIMMAPTSPQPQPQQQPKKPCPASEHRLEWDGAWQRGTDGKKFTAWRRLRCNIHHSCKLDAGHAGDHAFTGKKRCDKREKFTDSNGNGVWDENDGTWTDDGDGKPEEGEYTDANGDGKYTPPEKFEDKDKDGAYHGDKSETHYFDTKEERDRYIKEPGG